MAPEPRQTRRTRSSAGRSSIIRAHSASGAKNARGKKSPYFNNVDLPQETGAEEDDSGVSDAYEGTKDDLEHSLEGEDNLSLDCDALDGDTDARPKKKRRTRRASTTKAVAPKTKSTASSKKKRKKDEEDEDEVADYVSLDSDALDDDVDISSAKKKKKIAKSVSPNKTFSRKKRGNQEEDSDLDLKDGQTVIGTVVQAPKTGRGTVLR